MKCVNKSANGEVSAGTCAIVSQEFVELILPVWFSSAVQLGCARLTPAFDRRFIWKVVLRNEHEMIRMVLFKAVHMDCDDQLGNLQGGTLAYTLWLYATCLSKAPPSLLGEDRQMGYHQLLFGLTQTL
jgi:hypothetical protein